MMSDPLYILREEKVAARRVGDELMIMSSRDSALFSLNQSAAILWDAADGVTPLAEIVARDICQVFDIDADTALRDARESAEGLAKHGILRVSAHPFDVTTGSST